MLREDLLKKAGKMVIVYYHNESNLDCFAIGWFYAMDSCEVKLKVTSTRFETYESIGIEIDQIDKIEGYEINS